ncbi:MAG TPA: AMP-binding protein [Aeromicrobium sp.]|nr:AMP-binding protein [Aeromicrobium sp.]
MRYAQLEQWVHAGGEPLVVRTSGSSGEPKDVVLSHTAVLASARATLDRLGGPGHWLLALPVSGIAGIQVLVRSALAEREPVVLTDHPSLRSANDALDASMRRYAAVVPTQLHRWAEFGDELGALAELDAVLVGGAAIDPGLLMIARSEGVNVVRTYGMTETCGGCVYDGVPLDGVEVRVDDDGQVWLNGPTLFDGYVGEPREPGAWFATADRGEFLPDGRLRVLGRIDEMVVSGGVNIPLPAVEGGLRIQPGIADVAVVGVADLEWGARVVAAVVPAVGARWDLPTLRDAVEAVGMPRTWAPRQLLMLDELPMLSAGKVDRERLRRLANDKP